MKIAVRWEGVRLRIFQVAKKGFFIACQNILSFKRVENNQSKNIPVIF